jgi:glutamate formiminotransferase/formiminotetrahydrofolate cyclodeaminase
VLNFSEGKRSWVIKEMTIINVIRSTPDVYLLDVSVGRSANRVVITFIGSPEGVKEAAFRAIKRAAELIDMRRHKGGASEARRDGCLPIHSNKGCVDG